MIRAPTEISASIERPCAPRASVEIEALIPVETLSWARCRRSNAPGPCDERDACGPADQTDGPRRRAYPAGHHVAAWHDPSTPADAAVDIGHYVTSVRTAEAAKFDFAFVADRLAIPEGRPAALARVDEWSHGFEALTLAAALAA